MDHADPVDDAVGKAGRDHLAPQPVATDLRGEGLAPGRDLAASLQSAERGLEGTLLAPLLAKARSGAVRALDGAGFRADAILRHKGSDASLIVPEASLASRSGTRVLALSRLNGKIGPQGVSGLAGNILAGGEGLPNINGRIAQEAGGRWTARLAMADYAAGANRIAIPRLALNGGPSGDFAFEGLVTASGDLPGGGVDDLALPLEGTWSGARGLALGTRCTPVRFASLVLSGLALKRQALTLCPEGKAPMLAWRAGFWPLPAQSTWPNSTSSTSLPFRPVCSSRRRMTTAPSSGAGTWLSAPWKLPMAVRVAATMTTSCMTVLR